jgi:hypothetical protein
MKRTRELLDNGRLIIHLNYTNDEIRKMRKQCIADKKKNTKEAVSEDSESAEHEPQTV